MKTIRTLFTFVAAIAVCTNICACRQGGQQKAEGKTEAKGKTLVAYFSATGTTARAAQQIAKEGDGRRTVRDCSGAALHGGGLGLERQAVALVGGDERP